MSQILQYHKVTVSNLGFWQTISAFQLHLPRLSRPETFLPEAFDMIATSLLLRLALPTILLGSASVQAAPQTSIFIDQIPLYDALPACAEERVSAIIRAQSSGCGDNMQLTSFSCFCVDSSA
jgi:hypothetical protein